MGRRNYLVEGVSCAGKTTVAEELGRRGLHVVHGDRELAYQGDPVTGAPLPGHTHGHHLWDVERVRALSADRSRPATYFCGGSRNVAAFLDVFDEVFVLVVDDDTLRRRLDARQPGEWGAAPAERELVLRLNRTQEDVPQVGVRVDATQPLADVVDAILRR